MTIQKNGIGIKNAKSLIRKGKVDRKSSWEFTSKDSNKLLGDPPNWKSYSKWFLATDSSKDKETKEHYKFPFGKNGKVYRRAVIAAKQRASQFGYVEIKSAVDELLSMIAAKGWYSLTNLASGDIEVNIYGEIGFEVEAQEFIENVKALSPKKLVVRINSPGGSVFDGLAIYNYLVSCGADVECWIDGLAASAASVIACAGKLIMPENAILMLHNVHGVAVGESSDMRKQAEVMDKLKESLVSIYQKKSGLGTEEIEEMMDKETWLRGNEAKEKGFCDEVVGSIKGIKEKSMEYKALYTSLLNALGVEYTENVEELTGKVRDLGAKIAALETSNFVASIEPRVGSENAMLLGKFYNKLNKEDMEELVAKIEGMRKMINDLGSAKGEVVDEPEKDVDGEIGKRLKEIKAELGTKSDVEALVELAKREPELVANWR